MSTTVTFPSLAVMNEANHTEHAREKTSRSTVRAGSPGGGAPEQLRKSGFHVEVVPTEAPGSPGTACGPVVTYMYITGGRAACSDPIRVVIVKALDSRNMT